MMWMFLGLVLAKISLLDHSKYFYTLDTTDPSVVRIYAGGTAQSCASTSTTTTCNSCANLGAFVDGSNIFLNPVCNTHQINSNLIFRVRLQSDNADLMKTPNVVAAVINNISVNPIYDVNSFKPNTPVEISILWKDICRAATNNTNDTCTSSFSPVNLTVGFGSSSTTVTESVSFSISYRYVKESPEMSFGCSNTRSYEGFCYYYNFPGDQKAFVNVSAVADNTAMASMDLSSGVPSGTATADVSQQKYVAFRMFYLQGSNYSAITGSSPSVDLVYRNGVFQQSRVLSLENGKQYVFIGANVDQGGNATLFTNPASSALCPATDPKCYSAPYRSEDGKLSQTVVPNKVTGLLDDERCFIATAAYGSPMDLRVQILRDFRDRILLKSSLGRDFVDWYYRHSPSWAAWIAQSEFRKALVRAVLWPVLWTLSFFAEGDLS